MQYFAIRGGYLIMKEIFQFLRALRRHNDREWFAAHKQDYLRVKETAENFTARLIAALAGIDPEAARLTPADCTYRIYRDTRFSADKTPYKTHIGIFICPPFGKKSIMAGHYFHLEPDNTFYACGTWYLPPKALKAVRQSIYDEIDEYRSIVESAEFRQYFTSVGEDFLKTAPKGFPKKWQWIDYLRPRMFCATAPLSEEAVCAPDAIDRLLDMMRQGKRLDDFLNYTIEDYI